MNLRQLIHVVRLELFLSIVLGAVPVFIAYGAGGFESVNELVTSMLPGKILAWWAMGLTVFAAFARLANRGVNKRFDVTEKVADCFEYYMSHVGQSLNTVLHVGCGAIIAFHLLYRTTAWSSYSFAREWGLAFFGVTMLIEAVLLRTLDLWITKRWQRKTWEFTTVS